MGNCRFNDYEQRILDSRNPLDLNHRQDASFAAMSKRMDDYSTRLAKALAGQPVQQPVVEFTTTNVGVEIVAKTRTKDGKKMFLVDANGNAYSVDKATYRAAESGKRIDLVGDNAKPIDPNDIPEVLHCGPMKLGRCYPADVMNLGPYEEIAPYEGPVLIVHGTKDNIVDLEYSKRAQKAYKNARLEIIEGGAHGFAPKHDEIAIGYLCEFAGVNI